MSRDIILPWSCETHDLIGYILFKIVLFASPSALIFTFIEIVNPILPIQEIANYFVPLMICGLLGTLFSWIRQIMIWDEDGSLPSFRCRCDLDKKETRYEID